MRSGVSETEEGRHSLFFDMPLSPTSSQALNPRDLHYFLGDVRVLCHRMQIRPPVCCLLYSL